MLPSLILNLFLFHQVHKGETELKIKVLGVIDGDTLVLEGKTRLRLRHLDAPEIEFCGGKEAKEKLESLVEGKAVVLKEQILDTQGRPMALVYIKGKLVNKEMLLSGWARYHADNSSQRSVLKEAGQIAKEKGIGIFSPQCHQMENPEAPDCLIKGNTDKATKVKRYYFPGCVQYDFTIVEKDLGEGWFCTEEEAQKAGFEKSKTCHDKTFKL